MVLAESEPEACMGLEFFMVSMSWAETERTVDNRIINGNNQYADILRFDINLCVVYDVII